MDKKSKILIVGHDDVIERSLVAYFKSKGYEQVFSSSEIVLDTTVQSAVYSFFSYQKPDYVILGSTRSGGIKANQENGGEFIYHNLESQNNVVYAAQKFGTKKLLYIGSSCVYPKNCSQPMKEEDILTGELEETSKPYAIAKLSGIELCRNYRRQYDFNAISMIPATVYGPEQAEDVEASHVIGALIGKFKQALEKGESTVEVWGTGNPQREFLYSADFAQAVEFLMDHYDDEGVINAGCSSDIPIKELAQLIKIVSGFNGEIFFDSNKPDGVQQKLLDSTKINKLGWKAKTDLKTGISDIFNQTEVRK